MVVAWISVICGSSFRYFSLFFLFVVQIVLKSGGNFLWFPSTFWMINSCTPRNFTSSLCWNRTRPPPPCCHASLLSSCLSPLSSSVLSSSLPILASSPLCSSQLHRCAARAEAAFYLVSIRTTTRWETTRCPGTAPVLCGRKDPSLRPSPSTSANRSTRRSSLGSISTRFGHI